jgi:hypothetical protein
MELLRWSDGDSIKFVSRWSLFEDFKDVRALYPASVVPDRSKVLYLGVLVTREQGKIVAA